MIFADVTNSFMGSLVWAIIGLLGGASSVVAILAYTNRHETHSRATNSNPQGTESKSKRYNAEVAEAQYQEVTRRLDKHDKEIERIQEERAKSLVTINEKFERVLIGLTRIATKMGIEIPQASRRDEE